MKIIEQKAPREVNRVLEPSMRMYDWADRTGCIYAIRDQSGELVEAVTQRTQLTEYEPIDIGNLLFALNMITTDSPLHKIFRPDGKTFMVQTRKTNVQYLLDEEQDIEVYRNKVYATIGQASTRIVELSMKSNIQRDYFERKGHFDGYTLGPMGTGVMPFMYLSLTRTMTPYDDEDEAMKQQFDILTEIMLDKDVHRLRTLHEQVDRMDELFPHHSLALTRSDVDVYSHDRGKWIEYRPFFWMRIAPPAHPDSWYPYMDIAPWKPSALPL